MFSAPRFIARYYQAATDSFPHTHQPDKVAAYAWTYLGIKLTEMKLTQSSDFARRWKARNDEHLRQKTLKLAAHELEAAMEVAKTILRNNENCCYE